MTEIKSAFVRGKNKFIFRAFIEKMKVMGKVNWLHISANEIAHVLIPSIDEKKNKQTIV